MKREKTERIMTEDALSKIQTKYQTILENIKEGYFEIDLEGTFIFGNNALFDILGRPASEIIGNNFKEFTNEDSWITISNAFNNLYTTGVKPETPVHCRVRRKDGSSRDVELAIDLMRDGSGNASGFMGTSRDITEREKLKEALRKSEERFQMIFNNVSDGIFICDYQGRFKFMNKAGLEFTGYAEDEITSVNYLHLVLPEYRDRELKAYIKQVTENIEETYHEFPITNKRGKVVWVGQTVRMMKESEGKFLFYGIARDITLKKKAEDALIELDRQKSMFFANVSHEIRTPLTLILSPIESVLQGDYEGEVNRSFLENIYRNALRLLKLVNNLLDFSKIEAGRMNMKAREDNIVRFVKNCIAAVHSLAESRSISLNFSSENETIKVYMDLEKMDRVIMNLLSNALKFTDKGGAINICIRDDDDNCYIEFEDTGEGIPPDHIVKIFDRFTRVESSTRKHEGTGIGLALAKEYVEMHNGSINATSRHILDYPEDHGTKFTISIPKGKKHFENRADVIFTEERTTELDESVTDHRFVGMREMMDLNLDAGKKECILETAGTFEHTILIVDDNNEMREFLSILLKKQYHVRMAMHGADGLEKARECKPDLIITDVMMPVMDGYEMTRRIKENDELKHIPVMMITAKAEIENKIEGLEYGADDYLAKPFNSKELLARVRNLLLLKSNERKLNEAYVLLNKVYAEMKEDLMNAKIIQQNILSNIQRANNLSFFIEYRPLFEVGGDIYDIYPRDDGTTRIFLADATGHGVVASLVTMLIKAEYEKLKNTDIQPNEIFKSINDTFYKSYRALNMYFTGIILDIDPEKGRIAYSSAGHPIQYLIRNGGLITLSRSGRAVGFFDEINSKTIEIEYTPGDKILLFTDGLFEEFDVNYKEFGENRLKEIIAHNHQKSVKDILDNVIKNVTEFMGDARYNDDITAIGIE